MNTMIRTSYLIAVLLTGCWNPGPYGGEDQPASAGQAGSAPSGEQAGDTSSSAGTASVAGEPASGGSDALAVGGTSGGIPGASGAGGHPEGPVNGPSYGGSTSSGGGGSPAQGGSLSTGGVSGGGEVAGSPGQGGSPGGSGGSSGGEPCVPSPPWVKNYSTTYNILSSLTFCGCGRKQVLACRDGSGQAIYCNAWAPDDFVSSWVPSPLLTFSQVPRWEQGGNYCLGDQLGYVEYGSTGATETCKEKVVECLKPGCSQSDPTQSDLGYVWRGNIYPSVCCPGYANMFVNGYNVECAKKAGT